MDTVGQLDDAFADDAVAGLESLDRLANLDDFADPLMARRDGIADRNDVAPVEQLVVRVTDADLPHADDDLRWLELRLGDVLDHRSVGFLEDQRFHGVLP